MSEAVSVPTGIIERLLDIRALRQRVDEEQDKINEIQSSMYRITKPYGKERVQTSSASNDRLEKLLDRAAFHAERHLQMLVECEDAICEVENAVLALPAIQCRVVRLHYFRAMEWEEVGFQMHYTSRWCKELHRLALDSLRKQKTSPHFQKK